MKKVVNLFVCLLLIVLNFSTIHAQNQTVEDYQKFLDSRYNNMMDQQTIGEMWEVFYNHIEKDMNGYIPEIILAGPKSHRPIPTIDTLSGGNIGYVDGSLFGAKHGAIYSSAIDKDNNIWFVDASGKSIRRLNVKENKIETYLILDNDFNTSMTHNKVSRMYNYKEATISKVIYNPNDNNIYASVTYNYKSRYEGFSAIYQITPEVKMISFDNSRFVTPPYIYWSDFVKFDAENNLWFSNKVSSKGLPTNLFYAKTNNMKEEVKAMIVGKADWRTPNNNTYVPSSDGKDEAIITDKYVYVLNSIPAKLTRIQKYPRKIETIKDFGLQGFVSVTTRHNKFYGIRENILYEINIDGDVKTVADLSTAVYNSGIPIGIISCMEFDSKGNLIIFDEYIDKKGKPTQSYIRRLNL